MFLRDNIQSHISNVHLKALTELWGNAGEESVAIISGNSMWPLIRQGDELTIGHNIDHINRGDIIVFRTKGVMVAHRVVKIIRGGDDKDYYLTKGDCNRYFDLPLLTNKLTLGKVLVVKSLNRKHDYEKAYWRIINKMVAVVSGLFVNTKNLKMLWRINWGHCPDRNLRY
ncbi:MAG: signal peptidase I [Candidatus Schekmanbacteria bacterium]|nr:signal peptidase I [Candidatus Schekmanbacteria bacterium]